MTTYPYTHIAWSIAKQLLTWCVKISICIVFISITSAISSAYARDSAIELQRIKQRRLKTYTITGRHLPWSDDLREMHSASLLSTVSYATSAFTDRCEPLSACHSSVLYIVTLWIEHQSMLAWFFLMSVCVYTLVSSCPIGDIYSRIASEVAVYRFRSSVSKDHIAHGGL